MSAVFGNDPLRLDTLLPLLTHADPERVLAWRGGRPITIAVFLGDIQRAAAALPNLASVVNLCEDRYAFLVAFCAAAGRGQTTLLPPSRAPQAVDEALAAQPGSYALGDGALDPAPAGFVRLPAIGAARADPPAPLPAVRADLTMAIGFTSGSTGLPKPNPKTWAQFRASSANNVALLARTLDLGGDAIANVVATVPPQHMYGLELSVLLPLTGPFAVHAARPLFAADVADALAGVPAPRVLVTTPVHLRMLLRSAIALPPIAALVSATAPLSAELARAVESRYGTPLIEVFGSTETCVIAHRRCARERAWQLYPGIELKPRPDGTEVSAPYLALPVALQDVVELLPEHRFRLCGRNSDLLEIGGKRASLTDLTRRLQALRGVEDAVVFQVDEADGGGVRRIAALVVAPGRSETELLAELRRAIDPVFLPRPLRMLDRLPRSETGKLPRAALLEALRAVPGAKSAPEKSRA